MQLHMYISQIMTEKELRDLFDTLDDGTQRTIIAIMIGVQPVSAPILVAVFGGPIVYFMRAQFVWILFFPSCILLFLSVVLAIHLLLCTSLASPTSTSTSTSKLRKHSDPASDTDTRQAIGSDKSDRMCLLLCVLFSCVFLVW